MSSYNNTIRSFCRTKSDFNYINVFDRLLQHLTEPLFNFMIKEEISRSDPGSNKVGSEYTKDYLEAEIKVGKSLELHNKLAKTNLSKQDIRKLIFTNLSFVKKLDEEAYNNVLKLQRLI